MTGSGGGRRRKRRGRGGRRKRRRVSASCGRPTTSPQTGPGDNTETTSPPPPPPPGENPVISDTDGSEERGEKAEGESVLSYDECSGTGEAVIETLFHGVTYSVSCMVEEGMYSPPNNAHHHHGTTLRPCVC